ncbi:MAG: gliding motility protein GldL [Sphingomonadales bacterium]|jgi:gliding motility-associated protein GldL
MLLWFKRIDRFNLFYSLGAIVILTGVIAKFLEWEYEDEILIAGLCTEILVFAFSAFQTKKNPFHYKWERIFPDLLDTAADNPQDTVAVHDRIEQVTTGYIDTLQTHIVRLDKLNYDYYKLSDIIRDSMNEIATNAQQVSISLGEVKTGTSMMIAGISEFETLGRSSAALDEQITKMKQATELNSERLSKLEQELQTTARSIQELGALSTTILQSIKSR